MTRPFWLAALVSVFAAGGDRIRAAAKPKTFVRKDVSTLTAPEIEALKKGIQVMKDRDPNDPTPEETKRRLR
jgi:hypothetical protein